MIDKWYYKNLNARKDKSDAIQLTASIQRFPPGVLERFPTVLENHEIPSTVKVVCDRIVDDGFPEWSYDNLISDPFLSATPIRPAVNWTRLRLIREIAEKDYNAVMVTDNNHPVFPFDYILDTISAAPADMQILYLNWQGEPHNPTFNEECYNALARLEPSGDKGILKNFTGISAQVYFTPNGAKAVLDKWLENPCDFQCLQMALGGMEGCYVCDPSLVLAVGDLSIMYPSLISSQNQFLAKDRDGQIIEGHYYDQRIVELANRFVGVYPKLDTQTALELAEIASNWR